MTTWPPAMQAIQVSWVDSHHIPGWCREDEADKGLEIMECSSIGYVYKETADVLVLAMSLNNGGQVAQLVSIPKVAIVERIEIIPRKSDDSTC